MTPNFLPSLHPLRTALHNEIHARPAELMEAPLAITHIVMLTDAAERQASREHVCQLLREHHLPQPGEASTHVLTDVGPFHLRWELHTEFVAWTFSAPIEPQPRSDTRLPPTALEAVPCEWLARLPGQSLSNLHLWVLPDKQVEPGALLQRLLHEDTLVGSAVSGGAGKVYTDFAIHGDGYSRILLLASS